MFVKVRYSKDTTDKYYMYVEKNDGGRKCEEMHHTPALSTACCLAQGFPIMSIKASYLACLRDKNDHGNHAENAIYSCSAETSALVCTLAHMLSPSTGFVDLM